METLEYHVIANKLMSKYQRPCCVLTKVTEFGIPWENDFDERTSYQGSARGFTKTGIEDFKVICDESGLTMYTAGHENAFGIGILEDNIKNFINWTNKRLSKIDTEIKYRVDFQWNKNNIDKDAILTIADLNNVWSSTVEEPLVAVENLSINENNIFIYKDTTIKIVCGDIDLMIFNTDKEMYENLIGKNINIVGTAHKNEFMGIEKAQIFISDLEIVKEENINKNINPLLSWGF